MEIEFNLSEKIEINCESISHHNPDGDRDANFILVDYVKEFIRRLKEIGLRNTLYGKHLLITYDDLKELAGDKLI